MKLSLSNIITGSLLALSALAVTSCSLMEEDRDNCPTGLYVRFIYDYNTLRADLFKDHVGHVNLTVFDENGRQVAQRIVSNSPQSSPLATYGYAVHFSPSELPAGHSYRLQAVAMQRDWNEALAAPGAKYRLSDSSFADPESLLISLDHNNTPVDGTQQYAVDPSQPLDTLWHTLKVIPHEPADGNAIPDMDRTVAPYSIYPVDSQLVKVEKNKATYATVSLIRDTKHLNLTLRHVDEPERHSAADYEVKIIDNNAHLAHDNSVLTHDSLRYTPYASWTSRILEDNTLEIEEVHQGNPGQYEAASRDNGDDAPKVVQRTAHYNLMFNRLIMNQDDNQDNALLEIHEKKTGKLIARVNLPNILSQGRMAYEIRNYGHQEYLDREHDYHLDFFLKGDSWLAIEIHVLSWTKRVQNIQLK